ncbi:MAG: CCA tRNA nucleotidyltransferase, partial [Caulobacteraceae bacterium]
APTRAVMAALEAAGGPGCARFVGGSVRDALIGEVQPDQDIDIATVLTPPDTMAALKRAGLRAIPTGVEHGTVTAIADGRPFEITTLRRDVETDGRRAVVAFTTDWAEDAARRDFRLNALYAEADGTLHDPTGDGIADALAGRVVFVGDPETRIREDYLRILRFFRFYARYGRGEPDAAGLAACAALRQGLERLSGERVAKEVLKLLSAPDPGEAIARMAATGVLETLLAGSDTLRLEALMALERREGLERDPELRLAALLPPEPRAIAAASKRLRLSNALSARLLGAAGSLNQALTWQGVRRAVYALGPRTAEDRLVLAWSADPAGPAWRACLDEVKRWRPPPFPVTGEDIKARGVAEGPAVGRVRRSVEAWWIASDFPTDRAEALAALDQAVRSDSAG